MNTKTVTKISIFPADKGKVYRLLTKLETLQYIAWPYASFTPVYESASPEKMDPSAEEERNAQ